MNVVDLLGILPYFMSLVLTLILPETDESVVALPQILQYNHL
jgi:hypothetical protein